MNSNKYKILPKIIKKLNSRVPINNTSTVAFCNLPFVGKKKKPFLFQFLYECGLLFISRETVPSNVFALAPLHFQEIKLCKKGHLLAPTYC